MKLKQTGGSSGKGPSVTSVRMAGPHRSRHSQVLTPGTWASGKPPQDSWPRPPETTALKHNPRA